MTDPEVFNYQGFYIYCHNTLNHSVQNKIYKIKKNQTNTVWRRKPGGLATSLVTWSNYIMGMYVELT